MDIQAMTSAAAKSASPAMMTNQSATIAKRTQRRMQRARASPGIAASSVLA
jgi:hypothetical protein